MKDANSSKPRGYAFIEFKRERDMHGTLRFESVLGLNRSGDWGARYLTNSLSLKNNHSSFYSFYFLSLVIIILNTFIRHSEGGRG